MAGTQTLQALWLRTRAALAVLPNEESHRDSRLLIQAALRLTSAQFMGRLGDVVNVDQGALDHLDWMVARRAARCPVSHILGEVEFFGRTFEVTSDTLAPRADSETLVTAALGHPFERLLDVGTGTGCLAISLLLERPTARGVATDIVAGALSVATRNAARHGVSDRLELHETDWAKGVTGDFDLIISNPPYIDADVLDGLRPEVRDYEPRVALSPGRDGLAPYRELVQSLPPLLRPNGWLAFEVGAGQADIVVGYLTTAGLTSVEIVQDLTGKGRVVMGCKALALM